MLNSFFFLSGALRSSVIILLLCFIAIESSAEEGKSVDSNYLLGERIYKEGLSANNKFIPTTILGDIKVTGEQVICASCHRKSGMGTTEGQQVVPAVAGNVLFKPLQLPTSKPPAPPLLRPAYTRESLKTALITGIDANGNVLDPFMPRYEISDSELDSLIVYLNSLSATPDPGVSETDIYFSTIVIDGVDESRNTAMLDVFDAYIQQKNIETRNESSRAQNAPWHKEWIMNTYRKWKLQVWRLKGSSDTWADQLEEYYQTQPVFAVLNGLVDDSFGPIHRFCEDNGIPCLFPTTMLPTLDENDFYTLYMNRGYIFEGETLASHLNSEYSKKRVLHIADTKNRNASFSAYGLRANLHNPDYSFYDQGCDIVKAPEWETIRKFEVIAIHADQQCTDQLLNALSERENKTTIFLSTRLYGVSLDNIPKDLRQKTRFVHTHEMPSKINRLLARSTGWFKHKRILNPEEKEVQANAYFSLKVAGDALKHIRGYFFRDYFIEKIEHTIDDVPYTSIYPRLSLAPGQRFSSRGYYIAKIDEKRNRLAKITEWQAP
ncbi:MAG: cytochrome c [Candidatus Thiodiazotropha sp. (ex Myrtea sp. 'scaly one' KF741663)]|nr:cytochrome c [Candidatus Thiodiazotropha sp. (ex Myrtea sp. 'scaly one' KF741663)]